MSDLEALKNKLTELIEAESAKARAEQEVNSTQRILEALHAKIKEANEELVKAKAETDALRARTAKDVEAVRQEANLALAEANASAVRAGTNERKAASSYEDAEALKNQYQELLADISAQKDRLKAALAV